MLRLHEYPPPEGLEALVARVKDGSDWTDDESALVKGYFEHLRRHGYGHIDTEVVELFEAEWQEWLEQTGQRLSKCPQCDQFRMSTPRLPFFESRAEGTRAATEQCKVCRYSIVAHTPEVQARPHVRRRGIEPHEFVPHGAWPYDLHYCGCRGWD